MEKLYIYIYIYNGKIATDLHVKRHLPTVTNICIFNQLIRTILSVP